jgi:hypothetical protein
MGADELEYIFNDFSFGVGSATGAAWLVQSVLGLGMPDIKGDTVRKAGADGAWTYGLYVAESHIILSGEFLTDDPSSAFSDMYETWLAAFAPQAEDIPLQFNWPGWGPKYVNCKPENRHFDVDQLLSLGYTNWAVGFIAGDPVIYDDVLTS